MVKKRIGTIFLVCGLLCFLLGFFLPIFSRYRLIFCLLSILLFSIGISLFRKHKYLTFLCTLIISFFSVWLIDYIAVWKFDQTPALSFRIQNTNHTHIYNALYYRLWDCDGKRVIDLNYQKHYLCSPDELTEMNINAVTSAVHETYQKHKGEFIRIIGKVSAVSGMESLEMKGFTQDEDSLNGNVSFLDSPMLEFHFNEREERLSTLSVYDYISVIGRIDRLEEKNGKIILHMKDSYILNNDIYENFSIKAESTNYCEKDKKEYAKTKEYTYYTSCLNHMYVTYENADIYELSYALQEGKITLKELLRDYQMKNSDVDGNEIYTWKDYSMIICKNNEVILGNKHLTLTSGVCSAAVEKEESV